MSNPRRVLGAALLAALMGLLAACDSAAPATPPPLPAQPPTTAILTTPAETSSAGTTSTPSGTSSTVMGLPGIAYDVSGGFIGMHDVLEISPSGEARLSSKDKLLNTRQLDPQRVQKLSQLLAAADFSNLQAKYDNGQVADDIYESIAVTPVGNGPTKIVIVAAEG